ncbi:TM0106 family RecB-like putative nuclease [Sedimentimonas flavescens]|uniref:TM0106 family RecB-like putative nuclease n=1 Tax=Sedimentimonas flavescens TaxID=2851012 RepID=UPI001C4A5558|nr:TM0106 family RecB-like putative nuclease [Sedimentimonas flavescens]MBW0157613.1 TM0106 family RecB-like putative nuclease [Sedimentimonas flavescens]
MKIENGEFFFSASDLMRFAGCAHATTMDIARLEGRAPDPREDDAEAALLQEAGDAHEASHLDGLKASGKSVIEISREGLDLGAARQTTLEALRKGPEVVFQAAFSGARWGGWSDFLERVQTPSDLGSFSYEVTDTKLKRKPDPKHLLQLVLYSDLLAELQGVMPEKAHIELGNGERVSFRLADYASYARRMRARLEDFVNSRPETRPKRCGACGLCRWQDHCQSVWDEADSLYNVANISAVQIAKLEAAGITTMAALAETTERVPRISQATLERLVVQAQLQHTRKAGGPEYRLRESEPGKGFDLLPQPVLGDVFYDIEGDPHYEGGLEYLHGIWADGAFTAFWAHDHPAEKAALVALFDWFRARLGAYPQARIYHYAPYEVTALKRLTTKYGVGEAFLDRLLRERRFVDLYAVVRGGVLASEKNYSIKSMEAFYRGKRDGEVTTSGGSVVAYEEWRRTHDDRILEEIRAYNEVDCVSTEELRNWLVSIRPEGPWPVFEESAEAKEVEEDERNAALRALLAGSDLDQARQSMLFDLAQYHAREDKPVYWSIHDSLAKDEEELIDSVDAVGGLTLIGAPEAVKSSKMQRYAFPPQETRLRVGAMPTVGYNDAGFIQTMTLIEFDAEAGELALKIGNKSAHLLAEVTGLHPGTPLNTKAIRAAILRVIEDQCADKQFRAAEALLSRDAPRFLSGPRVDVLMERETVEGTIDAVSELDGSVLPIQGPPGTGKTYVTAHAIMALVRAGKRVAVASTSHEAVRNVLMQVIAAQGFDDPEFDIVHKLSDDTYPDDCPVHRAYDNDDAYLSTASVVGGTAFLFSRPEFEQAFDVLFIDEAGQVGLANTLAMSTCARNLVLIGDPRQLPQVVQGAHPEPANLSCLDWMQGDAAAIPKDRGIFLPVTRRMNPDVCRFISDQVYEGHLRSHPDTARQCVGKVPNLPSTGAHFIEVPHEGNAQIAREEVDAIRQAVGALLQGTWTDKSGDTRPLRQSDIIVVAPYNLQVNALRRALPDGIRVGTVDKFQGQEAPVCLVSMTASSGDEMPRGMEFLLSRERINVAVSRAQGLALVFGSPRLLDAKCTTVEQMCLVNTLCALAEMSRTPKLRAAK